MTGLRVGIAGAGAAAAALHAPGYIARDGCRLAGVASRTVERATRLAEEFGVPAVFPTIPELISSPEIDAVSICTPPHTHRELAEMAVAAGKHVLIEKPVAHTIEDVNALRKLAESAEVVVEVVRNERFMELHEVAREVVSSGRLGEIVSALFFTSTTGPDDWTGGSAWPKQAALGGGGVLLDLGVHKVDLAAWLLQSEIVDVTPALVQDPQTPQQGDVEWAGALTLKLAGGVLVSISASWLGPADAMLIVVAGSEGLLEANGATGSLVVTRPDGGESKTLIAPWSDEDRSNLAMIADFVEACEQNRRLEGFAKATWDSGTRWVLESYRRLGSATRPQKA
ncbi:MAG: Gfo/Idh/MocA family oxidoreductase [bacterium]